MGHEARVVDHVSTTFFAFASTNQHIATMSQEPEEKPRMTLTVQYEDDSAYDTSFVFSLLALICRSFTLLSGR